jgi:hypothetical protein
MRAALFLVISPQKALATLGARRDNFINQLIKCWVHDPEKWPPVFRKDHAQTMGCMIRKSGHRFSGKIMHKN